MVSQNKRALTKTEENKKTIRIEQGSFSIDLTVRIDIKQQLKDMIDVMEAAKQWAVDELAVIDAKNKK